MKVLFITRKFLPDVGGMEIAATRLYEGLFEKCNTKLIRCSGRKVLFPLKFPLAIVKSLWATMRWKPDVVLLQDVVMASLAPAVNPFCGSTVAIAHGLDVIYDNPLYQRMALRALDKCDAVVCISNATRDECVKRGLKDPGMLPVITYAVEDNLFINEDRNSLKKSLGERLLVNCSNRLIMLTVGRLVKRKGVAWFCENCLPEIVDRYPNVLYLVVGEGEMRDEIEAIVEEKGLTSHIQLLGKVSKEYLRLLYNASDIFVMPNIPQPGDMEGFGLVALEAFSCRLPVIASNLEGIKDAMNGGKIGLLLRPGDEKGFIEAVYDLADDAEKRLRIGYQAREFFLQEHNWEKTTRQYLELFQSLNGVNS